MYYTVGRDILFSTLFQKYLYKIKRLALVSLQHPDRVKQTIAEHKNILAAMKTGDVEQIHAITMCHMEAPQDINLQNL